MSFLPVTVGLLAGRDPEIDRDAFLGPVSCGHEVLSSICERIVRDRSECCGYRMVRSNHLSDLEHHLGGNHDLRRDGLHAVAHGVSNHEYQPATWADLVDPCQTFAEDIGCSYNSWRAIGCPFVLMQAIMRGYRTSACRGLRQSFAFAVKAALNAPRSTLARTARDKNARPT